MQNRHGHVVAGGLVQVLVPDLWSFLQVLTQKFGPEISGLEPQFGAQI